MDDTMSTLTKMTRTVKKLEVPRPLKSTTSSALNRNSVLDVKINSVDDLLTLTETVAYQMMQGNFDRALQSNVCTMYANLKLYGAQLEAKYKDFLDSIFRFFVVFRNGSQDERLDKKTRLYLLELIELRAKNWQTNDPMNEYYKHRGTHAEPLLVPTMEGTGRSVSPPPSPAPEPAALLAPGELIKTSGKFPKPTKIPGKNYSKDEVVIRNADSGKVSPGAKERLVQITGPNEENVNHAKHLIGDTIRRNASPVRLEGSMEGRALATSRASLDSNGSDERPREKSPHNNSRALLHSFSTNDAALGEYKYTVTFGEHSIKITGHNLQLVQEAKLALDAYFDNTGVMESLSVGAGGFFNVGHPPASALLMGDDVALNGADDEVFVSNAPNSLNDDQQAEGDAAPRRPRFSRAASTDKSAGAGMRQMYSYETLVQYADSPLSKTPPTGFDAFPAELARKSCLEFDSVSYLKRVRAAGGVTIAQDVPDSPEPE
ncbi:eukaryotic translation initiation factor 4E-binding protein Mextli isoform X6 [Maniola jurtina]|uniref:eukaryotic translation initiation factor 4E-binding protein Mextli isoform X6 n=1 Tax=Maniola jurtina TaxID=191418 RepID=UPI001E68E5C4|nr:eukaryotic translation initiation factor 4E-binding protein Mextli isoform X6 [Maniola jurtina]